MDFAWGTEALDVSAKNLPALKAKFVIDELPAFGTVVDIGCGGGKLLKTIAQHRPNLTLGGCDIRPVQGPSQRPFEFRLIDGSNEILPYPQHHADVVLIIDVLEHVRAPAFLLAEARRIVKRNGILLAFIPVEDEPLSAYRCFRSVLGDDLYVKTKDHIQSFTFSELEALLNVDFAVVRRKYAYHLSGQWMDAAFFAATRIPWLAKKFWQENEMYVGKQGGRSMASSAFNGLLSLANMIAWAESSLLRNTRLTASGILLSANPKARQT